MTYGASWAVYIDGKDLDPIEVARRAVEAARDPRNSLWKITDTDNRKILVVDLHNRTVVEEQPMKGYEEDEDGTIRGTITIAGPDGQPMDIQIESSPVWRTRDRRRDA